MNTSLHCAPPGNSVRKHFATLLTSWKQCVRKHFVALLSPREHVQGTLYSTAHLQGTVSGRTLLHCSTPGNTLFYCSPPWNSATENLLSFLPSRNMAREHFVPLAITREQCHTGNTFPSPGLEHFIIFSSPLASKFTDRLREKNFSLLLLRYIRKENALLKIGPKFGP